MKKPNTPIVSRQYQRKNSFAIFIFHDENTPVNTIIDDKAIIITDMPSTPSVIVILSGAYHVQLCTRSISASGLAALSRKKVTTNTAVRAKRAVAPVTITARIDFMSLQRNKNNIIKTGTTTNKPKIFIYIFLIIFLFYTKISTNMAIRIVPATKNAT